MLVRVMSMPNDCFKNMTTQADFAMLTTQHASHINISQMDHELSSSWINSSDSTTQMPTISSKQAELKQIYETLEYVQDVYVLPVICTVGIFGNCIVAYMMFARRRSSSSFIYMFAVFIIDSLSLFSDLLLPLSTLLKERESMLVREVAAYIYTWSKVFVSYFLRLTSLNILCVLSAERLIAIKYPLKLKSSLTVKKPNVFIALSFLVGVGISIPPMIFTEIKGVNDPTNNQTTFKRVYSQLYLSDQVSHDTTILVVSFFAGPVQIIFFCLINILIVLGIRANRKMLFTLNANNSRIHDIKSLQVKLCKIFLALCFTNTLAFLPNSVAAIVIKMFPELGLSLRDYLALLILHGGNFLRILNSASDFIIMLAMSAEIRNDVKVKCFPRKFDSPKENISKTYSSEIPNISEHVC